MKPLPIFIALLFNLTAFAAARDEEAVTVTAAMPNPTPEPSYEDPDSFRKAVLNTTNDYRTQHSALPLTWNNTLAKFASDHAKTCDFSHTGGPYGENLAIGYPNASAAIEGWGDEREDYNYKKGKFKKKTGHFTQLVWNDTEEVGCGRRECGDRGWIVVCEYWPVGNVEGEFEEMVGQEEDGGSMVRVGWLGLGMVFGVLMLVL